MELYVCWGTFQVPLVREHPCRLAHEALVEAGYDPEVKKAYSSGFLPPVTPGRRKVKELTGKTWVPALVTDDGEAIGGSEEIIAWAAAHPATARATA